MKTRIQQIGVSLEQDVYKQDDWPWVSFNGISLFIINLPVYNIVSLHLWKAGEYAKEKNVTISILAVEGERTGLEKVSKCAEISGGTINVLNPLEISRQLRLISQNYIIATYVTITLFLHPELEVDDPRFPKVC